LINPISNRFETCNLIRNLRLERAFISYDAVTKNCFLVSTHIRHQHEPVAVPDPEPEPVSLKKGPSIDKSKAGTEPEVKIPTIT